MIHIDRFETRDEGPWIERSAMVGGASADGSDFRLWFRVPRTLQSALVTTADPFLAAVLPMASALGRPLRVAGDISWPLLPQARQLMAMWGERDSSMHMVEIEADGVRKARYGAEDVGIFFSGGVDSFYSLLENLDLAASCDRISTLIVVLGFDIDSDNMPIFDLVLPRLRRVADHLGLKLVEAHTNQRFLTDRFARWPTRQMSSGLASVALLLAPAFRRIMISAETHALTSVRYSNSNPLTDPLWSTESLEIQHVGWHLSRLEKIERRISSSELALAHLRVCFANMVTGGSDAYNCGTCSKCLRTRLELLAAGALGRCSTFRGDEVEAEELRSLKMRDRHVIFFFSDVLGSLAEQGTYPDLCETLARVVRREAGWRGSTWRWMQDRLPLETRRRLRAVLPARLWNHW